MVPRVTVTAFYPDDAVHDAVHDRVGVDAGTETMAPVTLRVQVGKRVASSNVDAPIGVKRLFWC